MAPTPSPAPTPAGRGALRDAGLRRMRRASRWLAGGAVVLTGLFAGLAARATHTTTSAAAQVGDERAAPSGATLQPPAQSPQSAPSGAAPHASSGAS